MSLHDPDAIKQFGRNCHQVWTSWLLPAVPTPAGKALRITTRRSLIRSHIATAGGGIMPPPSVRWELAPGTVGVFSGEDWTLTLSAKYTENDGIVFSDFVRLSMAIYHELRHAEQFYRMAQGLASGDLHFPDMSQQNVTQAVANVKGATSVKDKAASFETMTLTKIANASRTQIIQKWLGHSDGRGAACRRDSGALRRLRRLDAAEMFQEADGEGRGRGLDALDLQVIARRDECVRDLREEPVAASQQDDADIAEEQDARGFAEAVAAAFQTEMKFPFEILKDQSRLNLELFRL